MKSETQIRAAIAEYEREWVYWRAETIKAKNDPDEGYRAYCRENVGALRASADALKWVLDGIAC